MKDRAIWHQRVDLQLQKPDQPDDSDVHWSNPDLNRLAPLYFFDRFIRSMPVYFNLFFPWLLILHFFFKKEYLEKAESELRWIESLHESRLDDTDAVDGRRSTGRKKLMQTPYLVLPFFYLKKGK
jgi:hypothetical protein